MVRVLGNRLAKEQNQEGEGLPGLRNFARRHYIRE